MFKIPIFHMILKITNSRLLNRISKWFKSLWGRDSRQVVMVEEIPILEGGFYKVSNGSRYDSWKHRVVFWWTVFHLSQSLYLKTVEGASNIVWISSHTWWRNQMETFSALLAICAGNSPVSGEFPAQRPVTRSFDVFFDVRLIGRLSKQPWGWWL